MSERYSRLFALPENLYAVGSPVVIAAGTLLKDTQTGRIVAQLKLRSISDKIIKAVKVKLYLYDTAGNSIDEPVVHNYLDLSISRDTEFAQKNPIPISNNTARSYKVSVTEVVFAGQSVWAADNENWEPLSKPSLLTFDDPELQKQYQIKFGRNSKYEPKAEKDLWYCTCGALNHENEICHCCNNSLLALQTADIVTLKEEKDARLEAQAKRAAEEKAAREAAAREAKKKTTKLLKIAIPVVCAVIAIVCLITNMLIPSVFYKKAESFLANGDIYNAAIAFGKSRNYKDARERSMALWSKIVFQETFSARGAYHIVALRADGSVVATGDNEYGQCNVSDWTDIIGISVGDYHTIGLKSDGTVVATNLTGTDFPNWGQCEVSDWTNIVAISTNSYHTVGLKTDGTVVATKIISDGNKCDYSQSNISDWTDIVAISASPGHTVGLKSDGTVVAAGRNEDGEGNVSDWTDIIAISAEYGHTIGLKSDGTVVATGSNSGGVCNVSDWTDIVAISTCFSHTVGLHRDGTVVAVGYNYEGQCDVSDWTDIVAISTSHSHTVGLKADGTVVATEYDFGEKYYDGQCDVSDWSDIAAIRAGGNCTLGLKSNGTIVLTDIIGDKSGRNVSGWTDIQLPD